MRSLVELVVYKKIVVLAGRRHRDLLERLRALRVSWWRRRFEVPFEDERHLALIFKTLRDADFGFQGGVGWNPSFVFRALREMGLLEGAFDEVVREAWRRDRVVRR
jgi:hypothetical protein